jgi:hypothetical protein
MAMTGRVEKFGPIPNTREGVQILSGRNPAGNVTVKGGQPTEDTSENAEVEVRVHEEVVTSDKDKIRVEDRKPGDPEVRVRSGNRKEWEQTRTLDNEY